MDNSVLKVITAYRNKICCQRTAFSFWRMLFVFLCLAGAVALTYVISGNISGVVVNTLSKVIVSVFIALCLILAGYLFYGYLMQNSRYKAALSRLDILITKADLANAMNPDIVNTRTKSPCFLKARICNICTKNNGAPPSGTPASGAETKGTQQDDPPPTAKPEETGGEKDNKDSQKNDSETAVSRAVQEIYRDLQLIERILEP